MISICLIMLKGFVILSRTYFQRLPLAFERIQELLNFNDHSQFSKYIQINNINFLKMKQEMKKLKGTSVSTSMGELILKQFSRMDFTEYDQLYFYSTQDFLLCKLYNLQSENSIQRYEREKQIYAANSYPSLVACIGKSVVNVRKIDYGILVLDKICKNSSLNEIGNSLSFFQLLQLTTSALNLIKELKNRNEIFLNLRPQNIYLSVDKTFLIINPEYVCEKGSHSSVEEANDLFFSNVQKYFKYCSPEVLDNYTYFPIDSKSDIFSLGCILYEIIYGKYPFESKFANINIIYEKQEGFFGVFLEKIFKPYKQRALVEQLQQIIEDELKKNPSEAKQTNTSSTTQSKSSKNPQSSFFDDISSVFNKYTKQSEGAYLNFCEDNGSFPQSKHLSFILTKLYKNPKKVEKLQSIVSKHIKMTSIGSRKNFLTKNLVLIFLLLRKNRNYIIEKWKDNIAQIKETLAENDQCHQLCNIIVRKIDIQQELNCILKGNFYLEDVCQFKLLTISNVQNMIRYLEVLLVFGNKLLNYKQDDYLFQYVLQNICDQIYDLISMIIFIVICIRKDNQLNLRKDNLNELTPIQKSLNILLKKINNLSNSISFHAIYSVEAEFYNYKEDIYLNETPQHTSFQYFTKYCKHYKGLSIPVNNVFSSSSQNEEFSSHQLLDRLTPKEGNKKYFNGNQINSDQEETPQLNEVSQPKNEKVQVQKANSSGSNFAQKKPVQINNLFGNNFFQQQTLKKTKSSQGPLVPEHKQSSQLNGFDDFTNFFAEVIKKQQNNQGQKVQNAKKTQNLKPSDIFQNFSFFQEESIKKSAPPKLQEKVKKELKKEEILNLLNFTESPPKKVQKAVMQVDLNALNEDIFNYEWLKKSEKNPVSLIPVGQKKQNIVPVQQPGKKLSPFVVEIVSSLKLKQLKDLVIANKQVVIEFEKLLFQKVIGSGSAGEVYLGKYSNQSIAIKKVKTKQNPNALKQFQRQLVTYIKIKKNPYLVSLVGLSKSGEDFYLLTQFCSGGSLFDLLHKKAGQIFLSWKAKMSLILQVAKGMKALHDMKPPIIHRDLKSLNVFILFQKNQWVAKVADFGLSRSPQSQMMTMALGTLHWMAPQLLDNKQYSLKVDVYSFGVVMWQICARKTPYYELSNPMAIMKYVTIDKKRPNMSIIDINCPPSLLELIQRCWDEDPTKRPFFNQIIQALNGIDKQVLGQ